jgi:DNA-binding winged helix-turn-helix (wHTH) protein
MRGSLRAADRDVELRPKSFEVLRYLVENPGRLVSKEQLIKIVWPDVIVTDDSLTQCVSEIRHAIGDSAQTIVKTVPRRGYRFVAPVSIAAETASAPP